MNKSDRTTIFLINFLAFFGGSMITGLILIWLFPIDEVFPRIAIPSLFGFSIIMGIIIGLIFSLSSNQNKK